MQKSSQSYHANKTPFEVHYDEIWTICLRKARCFEASCDRVYQAMDLAQIAVVKVWKAFDNYDPSKARLSTYVNKIAFSAFIDTVRGKDAFSEERIDETRPISILQGKVVTSVNDDDEIENRPAYSVENESNSIDLAFENLLAFLPHRQRLVIEMSFGLGDSWWERPDESIAEELDITRQTVISDRKKALLDMQTRVGRTGVWVA